MSKKVNEVRDHHHFTSLSVMCSEVVASLLYAFGRNEKDRYREKDG